jgi:hypothetical protein
MRALNNGDGTWAAVIEPIGAGGGTVVATAYPNSEENFMGRRSFAMEDDNTNAPQGQGLLQVVPAPSGVYISSYQESEQEQSVYPSQPGTNTNQFLWQNGQGGMSMLGSLAGVLDVFHWPATSWPQPLPGGVVTQVDLNLGISNTWNIDAPTLPEEHYNISIANPYYGVQYLQRTADTQMKLATGGMPGSTHMNVWLISCSATNYSPPWGWGDAPIVSAPIDPRNIRIPSGQFDSNGNLYLVLPDNTNLDVTPFVTGPNSDYYTFNITATKYRLVHQCVAIDPPDRWRLTLGVGEQVNFYFDPALPTNVSWAGGSGGGFVPTNGAASTFTAASNQASAPVFFAPPPGTMQSPTEMRRQVTVFPPANIVASNTEAPWPGSRAPKNLETNKAGAATGFALLIEPTNVPFSVVEFMEVGSPPTEVTGFFANTNIYTTNAVAPAGLISIYHDASFWYRPFNAHNYGDSVWIRPISPPYSNGSFQWVITNQWKLNVQGAPTNFFLVTTQTFNLDSNGTVTITKFGNHGVTRQTNGFVTNW